jgi:hypothetical protein
MKKLWPSFSCLTFVVLLSSFACPQVGPTPPKHPVLNWTQSTSTGVVSNCVYRGSSAGTYTMPAINVNAAGTGCSPAPIVTYTDLTAQVNVTYYYAVTAQSSSDESGYSNDSGAVKVTATTSPTSLGKLYAIPNKEQLYSPEKNK